MPFKKISISLIILIIGVVIGFNTGMQYGKDQSALEIARLNEALDVLFPLPPKEVFSVYGTITTVNNNELSLEITSPSQRQLPGVTPQKETRIVTVTQNTKMSQFDPFSAIENPEELDDPTAFSGQTTITLDDLQVGDNVSVSAEENIKTIQSFVASEITKTVF